MLLRVKIRQTLFIIAILTGFSARGDSQWRLLNDFTHTQAWPLNINSIYFLPLPGPPKIGFIGLDGPAEVWKTSDGGINWKRITNLYTTTNSWKIDTVFTDIYSNVYDFTFKDSLTGWFPTYCGASGVNSCFKTTDCGETWIALAGTDFGSESVHYHNATNRLFLRRDIGIYSSTDEGNTWQYVMDPLFSGCAFSDDSIGVFTGADLFFTTDGGQTWNPSNSQFGCGCVHPLAIRGTKTFFMFAGSDAIGTSDTSILYRTDDGGQNWVVVSVLPGRDQVYAVCGDLQHIYLQTRNGVLVSTDQGVTFQNICGPINFFYGNNPVSFYVKGNYIYAAENDDDNAANIDALLWLDTTGIGSLNLSVYLKSNSISSRSGDTINIPVYLSGQSWALYGNTNLSLPFVLDTNMLTPVGFVPSMSGISFDSLSISHDTVLVNLQDSSFVLDSEQEIGYLRCVVYLSDTLQSSVILASPQVTSQDPNCLALSTTTDAVNISITSGCGDSLILAAMQSAPPFSIESVQPNPATGSAQINFINPQSTLISYEVIDALGKTRMRGVTGGAALSLDVSALAEGVYFFRAFTPGSISSSRELLISR